MLQKTNFQEVPDAGVKEDVSSCGKAANVPELICHPQMCQNNFFPFRNATLKSRFYSAVILSFQNLLPIVSSGPACSLKGLKLPPQPPPHSPGVPCSANRRPAAASDRDGPRREEAAFSGKKPCGRLPLQAETETVGQLSGEEGGRPRQHECVPDGVFFHFPFATPLSHRELFTCKLIGLPDKVSCQGMLGMMCVCFMLPPE